MSEPSASHPAPEADAPPSLPRAILLYDGECGLCHASVRLVLRREKTPLCLFAPLSGETAAALSARLPGRIPTDGSTVVLVDGDEVLVRSRAAFRLARGFSAPWSWLAVFRFLPAFLTDLPYRLIARLRRALWGRADACALPSPAHAQRMLP